MKKNCKKLFMEDCSDCIHKDICVYQENCSGDNCADYHCQNYIPESMQKPQTNRQWLESLSDEELAIELSCIIETSAIKMKQWLQAEHKE